jgi:hypothetical protein
LDQLKGKSREEEGLEKRSLERTIEIRRRRRRRAWLSTLKPRQD